jgi:hypothetical protein
MIGMKSLKKTFFLRWGYKIFWVAAILVGRSERGNKRYFILGLTGEGLQNLGICSALRAFEQEGIFIMPHLLRYGTLEIVPVSSDGPPHLIASYYTQGSVEDTF